LNAGVSQDHGAGVHVGVIDSLGEPDSDLAETFSFDHTYDYVDHDQTDPIGHGRNVFDIIATQNPNATFSTFQIIDEHETEDGTKWAGSRSDTIQAIVDAAEAGVDVLNISAGTYHDCYGFCSLCREAELAVRGDDMTIVAATGNSDNSNTRIGVHCPATNDAVIGVGGYLSHCTEPLIRGEDSGQWWLDGDEINGPFCGQNGCCSTEACLDNRREVPWPGNVSYHNAAPNVLAPVIYILGADTDSIQPQIGTSFAAPLVSGCLVGIICELQEHGITPEAEEISTSVRMSATEIDEGDCPKFDAEGTWEHLC
jgi:hypothetical protein